MDNKDIYAFPVPTSEMNSVNQDGEPFNPGMTLRDYYAGQILMAMVGNSNDRVLNALTSEDIDMGRKNLANNCYAMADAMLEARKWIEKK